MQFIIMHGSFGKQSENWFSWLRKELEQDGHIVIAKNFPIENWDELTMAGQGQSPIKKQSLYSWTKFFDMEIMPDVDSSQPIGLIAHSLAPMFMLNIIQSTNIEFSVSIFVAPFYQEMQYDDWQVEAVNFSFRDSKYKWKTIKQQSGQPYVLYSDNDPYVQEKFSIKFADKIDAEKILYRGAGHFNADAGWTKAPLILELCRSMAEPK